MAGPFDLTGQDIENTYQRVLQTDGTDIYDGTGSLFTISSNINTGSFVTTSSFNSYTGSNTSQFAGTASYANYAETASSALNAQDILIRVLNQSGNPITKGLVVHISSSNNSSDIPRIITASYENDNNSANTLGITNETIVNGTEGFVITEGILKGVNTSEFTSGQLIYLGPTGSIIGTAPVAPLHSVRLGQVIRHQSNNGSIYVRIDNGYELGELHDVKDTTTSFSYGDLLIKSGSIWINSRSLTGSYEITGSLKSTIGFTGSLFGTASFVTGSILTSANPARFATQFQVLPSSSAALNVDTTLSKFYPILVPVRNDGNNGSALAYYNSGSFSYDFGTNTLTVTSSYANQALSSSFSVTSSFALSAPSTTPGGSSGQLQYNNGGIFGGISNTSWNGTTISGLHTTNGTFLQATITPSQSNANVNISLSSYTLPGAGTYRITQAHPSFGTTNISFPKPTSYDLQQIIIINADTNNNAAINATYQPILANGTALGSLTMGTPYIFVAIGGNWYLISSS